MSIRGTMLYSLYVVGLGAIPRNLQIPDHYWISSYEKYALKGNQHIISTTPEEPTGLTNVTWPLRKFFGTFTELWDYAVDGPLIAGAYFVEKALRGDFHSAVTLAKENVRSLKEHNVVYDQELNKLEPVAQLMVELVKLSLSISSDLQAEITQTKEVTQKLQKEVQEITEARKEIDLEAVKEAAEKVAKYVKAHLKDDQFVEKLKQNDARLEGAQSQLDEAVKKLQTAQKKYEENLETLESLWSQYEELGVEQTTYVKQVQSQVEQLIRQRTPTPQGSYVRTVEVNV